MAFLAAIPAWVYGVAAAAGTVMSAVGQYKAGKAEDRLRQRQAEAKDFEAKQLEIRAQQEEAAAQRASAEEKRRAAILGNRALAVAAAQGGASDPTVVDIIADIAGEGAYRAGVALFEGQERARAARMGVLASRYEGATLREAGASARRGGAFGAAGSLVGGVGSLYGKYGMPTRSALAASGTGSATTMDAGTPGLYPYG